MIQRVALFVMMVGASAVGCGAAQTSDEGASVEKVGATSQALIQIDAAPPYTFPYGVNSAPNQPPNSSTYWKNYTTCSGWVKQISGPQGGLWTSTADCDQNGNNCSNFLAHPATNAPDIRTGQADPYLTTYTHGYQYNETNCPSGDRTCQAAADFYSIPSAHGFKYLVDQVTSISCGWAIAVDGGRLVQRCSANGLTHSFYFSGLARVDQSWWMKPWQYQAAGTPVPWGQLTNPNGAAPFFDINAHPSMGNNAVSGDWQSLWNFAYTYAYPNGYYQDGTTRNIEAQHHQCSMIYRPVAGNYYKDGIPGLAPVDFFVAGQTDDPIGGCGGGGCW